MYRSLILDINSPVVFIITAREFSCLAWLNYSTILQKLISFTCTPVSVKKTNTYCFVSLLLMAGWGKEEKAKRGRKKWKMENLSIRYTKQAHHSCPGANKSRDLSEPIPICESATAYAALESESEPVLT